MALDFAFLGGLTGRRDWNSIKAEKKAELQYQSALNAMQQQEIDNQAMLKQQLDEYQNTINEISVTPIGRERINVRVNEPMKQAIAEKIKKYGGDLETYMKVEGAADMNNYLRTLVNHPETQKELKNASDISKWRADKQAGLEERLQFDPTTGQLTGAFNDKLQKYLNGETETIDYEGAFKPQKFDETIFSKLYGSENRYKSVPVTEEDYAGMAYRYLQEQGLSERDAAQQSYILAKDYRDRVAKGGTPLRWKSDEYTPPTVRQWEYGEQAKQEDAKYVIEQLAHALTGSPDVYTEKEGVIVNEKTGESVKGKFKRATVLSGTPLGEFSFTVDGEPKVETNLIEDWEYVNGKPKIKTTESAFFRKNAGRGKEVRVKGKLVDNYGYMEVTDDIISGIANAKKIPYHSLRKGLIELKSYTPRTPEVESSGVNTSKAEDLRKKYNY